MDENCSGVLIFCLFVQKREAKLDPITDIFRTMHVTAFGQHRLEATAPWGVIKEKQTEEKVTPAADEQGTHSPRIKSGILRACKTRALQ